MAYMFLYALLSSNSCELVEKIDEMQFWYKNLAGSHHVMITHGQSKKNHYSVQNASFYSI